MHLAFHFLDLFFLNTDLYSAVVHLGYQMIPLRCSFYCLQVLDLRGLLLDVRVVTRFRMQLHLKVLVLLPVRADVTTIAHFYWPEQELNIFKFNIKFYKTAINIQP